MGPVLDDGCPEGVEEREEEARRQREEEGGEGFGEALLGYGSVGVEDACASEIKARCWSWKASEGGASVQKKRPFQILRSSMVVKERPEQR